MLRSKPLALPAAAAAALLLVTVAAGADGPVVTATRTLAGLDDGAAGGFEPPDVSIAAGRGFVVEFVNVAARAWTTTGDPPQLAQTRDLASLFGSGKDRLTDPRVVFDSASGRFFASISDVDRGAVLLAVSTSGDPTAAWTVSSYAASGCADQPRLGISDDVVVLAADVFEGCNEGGAATLGAELWTVNK